LDRAPPAITQLYTNLRLLCTSRHIDDPSGFFHKATRLEIRASWDDLETYIKERIASSDNLVTFCDREPTLRQQIVEDIASKSEGM
jgi:hypothetical protein